MWITLYDVSRDGIGFIPWLLAAFWVAGIIGGGLFVLIWLTFWLVAGGFGLGYGVFNNYAANVHALKAGSREIAEGPIESFHLQTIMRKGR
jgi:hypothetical protein